MEAPAVQYVTSSDGYSIAYAVSGQGQPVIFVPPRWSHVQLSWHSDILGDWWQGLSARVQLVLFDQRGTGMSTRGLPDAHTFDHYQRDLAAVIERLQLKRFILFGSAQGTHVSTQYALGHPENVTALVLMHPLVDLGVARAPALYDTLPAQDWNIFLRSVADTPAQQEYLRQSISQNDWLRAVREFRQSSIEDALPNLRQPTLVLHAKDNPRLAVEESMNAARLAHAQFVLIEGSRIMGDARTGIQAIERFIASVTPDQTTAPSDDRLSQREIEVLRLLAAGRSNQQIADELVISLNTVRRHVSNVFDKTGVANRTEASVYARDHGLV